MSWVIVVVWVVPVYYPNGEYFDPQEVVSFFSVVNLALCAIAKRYNEFYGQCTD